MTLRVSWSTLRVDYLLSGTYYADSLNGFYNMGATSVRESRITGKRPVLLRS